MCATMTFNSLIFFSFILSLVNDSKLNYYTKNEVRIVFEIPCFIINVKNLIIK